MKTTQLLLGLLIVFILGQKALSADFNQVVSSGTTEHMFGVCMTSDLRGYAVGNNGEVVVTTDGGNNWSHMPTGFFTGLQAIKFVNTNTGYAVGLGGLILKTTNAGLNWSGSTPTSRDLTDLCFIDANTGYVVGNFSTAIKTTNGGVNWIFLNTNLVDESFTSVACTPTKVFIGILYAVTNLITSTDGGNTWLITKTRVNGNISSLSIEVTGSNIYIAGFEIINSVRVPALFRSSDNGGSWNEPILSGNASLNDVVIVPNYPNLITVVGRYFSDPTNGNKGYISRSTDGGNTWVNQPAYGTGTVNLNGAFSTETNCFIVGDNGLILKGDNLIAITPISIEVPKRFALSQNYPNPFNPTTNINFAVKEAGVVKMYIFNSIGQEVAVLVNQHFAPGIYNVDFNAGSLTSGIYFYRMEAKNFSETKKMVLVK